MDFKNVIEVWRIFRYFGDETKTKIIPNILSSLIKEAKQNMQE